MGELTSIYKTGATVVFVTGSIPEAVSFSHHVVRSCPSRVATVIDVELGQRDEATREATDFFKKITEVREALRGLDVVGRTRCGVSRTDDLVAPRPHPSCRRRLRTWRWQWFVIAHDIKPYLLPKPSLAPDQRQPVRDRQGGPQHPRRAPASA